MFSSNMFAFILCLILTIASISESSRPSGCGFVYDGDTNGRFDLDEQSTRDILSANWFGFDEDVVVLYYEWAIVTSQMVASKDSPFWHSDGRQRCRDSAGLDGVPDVQNWIKVGPDVLKVTANNLNLIVGQRYYFVVKAVSEHNILYTNSDGITISGIEEKENLPENVVQLNISNDSLLSFSTAAAFETAETVETLEIVQFADQLETFPLGDRERYDRCFRGVGAYLTELYGPPVFAEIDPNRLVLLDTITHESSSGLTDGEIAGIVVAVVVFSFLLLLLLILLVFKSRSKDNKFQTTLYTDQDVENIDTDYKAHRQRDKDSVSSTSKVEFPDTHIRRLSIGNARDLEVEDAPEETGKRGAMVLDSQTSSLRDYRKNI